jgi:hypothetical protein
MFATVKNYRQPASQVLEKRQVLEERLQTPCNYLQNPVTICRK